MVLTDNDYCSIETAIATSVCEIDVPCSRRECVNVNLTDDLIVDLDDGRELYLTITQSGEITNDPGDYCTPPASSGEFDVDIIEAYYYDKDNAKIPVALDMNLIETHYSF